MCIQTFRIKGRLTFCLILFWLASTSSVILFPVLAQAFQPAGHTATISSASICCAGNRSDDFADGNLAPLWIDLSTCGSVSETGGQLVLTRPSGCDFLDGPEAWLDSNLIICGNFDVQIDFALLNWPAPSLEQNASFYVSAGTEYFAIGRHRAGSVSACIPYTDSYRAWQGIPDNCNATWVQSSDLQGKFRITRIGTTLQSYYWNGSAWVLVRTGTMTTALVSMGMLAQSTDGTPATVAFDNLVLVSAPPADNDQDGIPTCVDNCPGVPNPLQEDTDSDLVGDSCDNCPAVANTNQNDFDEDGVGDLCDICPTVFNPLQQNIKPGDVDSIAPISLPDVIQLVNYVFDKDRPATGCLGSDPGNCWNFAPPCRGEVNGNPPISLPDVIYLVNYVFDKDRPATGCLGSNPVNCWIPVPTGVCCVPVN